jgi:hypothetical protein
MNFFNSLLIFSVLGLSCWTSFATDLEISASGKRRLEENLQTLSKNIEDTLQNIQNSAKNALTLEEEFKQVELLEQEHLKLKDQYRDFIKKASDEIDKNAKALQALLSYSNNKDKEFSATEKEKAKAEQQDRTKWAQDTQTKIAKVRGLLDGLSRNFEQLRSRKNSLSSQKQIWLDKKKGHEKLLEELRAKKDQTEKTLKGGSK